MVNYGVGLTYIGLVFTGAGVMIAKTAGEYLADKEFDEAIKLASLEKGLSTANNQCSNCDYHLANELLKCAVNPDLPKDCSDFTPKN